MNDDTTELARNLAEAQREITRLRAQLRPITYWELLPVIAGSLPHPLGEDVARNVALGVELHLEYRDQIEALQWDGTAAGATPIIDWVLTGERCARYHDADDDVPNARTEIVIDTHGGKVTASPGDWIVRDADGGFRVTANR